jgi:hypothetical protein
MQAGYSVHLANTSAIKPYEGLKYTDDPHEARRLAHLLRLNILPEGYIQRGKATPKTATNILPGPSLKPPILPFGSIRRSDGFISARRPRPTPSSPSRRWRTSSREPVTMSCVIRSRLTWIRPSHERINGLAETASQHIGVWRKTRGLIGGCLILFISPRMRVSGLTDAPLA